MGLCGVARVLDEMEADDRQALLSLLSAPIPAAAVSRELEAAGFAVSYQTVYRHRVRTCNCEKA